MKTNSSVCQVEEKGWFGKVTKPCLFEAVYDEGKAEGMTSEDIVRLHSNASYDDTVTEVLETLRPKTYVGAFCAYCGKFVDRKVENAE